MYNFLVGGFPLDYGKQGDKHRNKQITQTNQHPTNNSTSGNPPSSSSSKPTQRQSDDSRSLESTSTTHDPLHSHHHPSSSNIPTYPKSQSSLQSSQFQLHHSTPQSQQYLPSNHQSFIPTNLQEYYELQYLSSLQTSHNHPTQAPVPHRVLHSLNTHPRLTAEKKKKMRDRFFAAVERGDRNAIYHMVMSCQNVFGDGFDIVNSPNDHGMYYLITLFIITLLYLNIYICISFILLSLLFVDLQFYSLILCFGIKTCSIMHSFNLALIVIMMYSYAMCVCVSELLTLLMLTYLFLFLFLFLFPFLFLYGEFPH